MQTDWVEELAAAKRAWIAVISIVFILSVFAALLLRLFGQPMFLVGSMALVMSAGFAFFVQTGYFVDVPQKAALDQMIAMEGLERTARMFCIRVSGKRETYDSLLEFVNANRGRRQVWVAPERLRKRFRRKSREMRPVDGSRTA